MNTAISIANIVLFAAAAATAWSSSRTADSGFRAARRIKAILASMYAVGITLDLWVLTSDEWRTLARYLGVVSIPAVWIVPDVLGQRYKTRQAARIDDIARRALGGEPPEAD